MSIRSVALFQWIHIPTVYLLPTFPCFLASDFTERFGDREGERDLYFHFPSITSSSAPFAQRLQKYDARLLHLLLAKGSPDGFCGREIDEAAATSDVRHPFLLPAYHLTHKYIHCFLLTLLPSKIFPLLATTSHRKLIEGSLIQFRSSCEPCIILFCCFSGSRFLSLVLFSISSLVHKSTFTWVTVKIFESRKREERERNGLEGNYSQGTSM